MNAHSDLDHLYHALRRKLHRLDRLSVASRASRDSPVSRRTLSYVCIESLSAWSEFNKFFVLSCAIGAKTRAGTRVRTDLGSGSFQEMIDTISSSLGLSGTRTEEIQWRDVFVVKRIANEFNFSNIASVSSAAAISSSTIRDLATVRNFYAHKGPDTWRSVKGLYIPYSVAKPSDAEALLLSRYGTQGLTLIRYWLNDLDKYARAMTH